MRRFSSASAGCRCAPWRAGGAPPPRLAEGALLSSCPEVVAAGGCSKRQRAPSATFTVGGGIVSTDFPEDAACEYTSNPVRGRDRALDSPCTTFKRALTSGLSSCFARFAAGWLAGVSALRAWLGFAASPVAGAFFSFEVSSCSCDAPGAAAPGGFWKNANSVLCDIWLALLTRGEARAASDNEKHVVDLLSSLVAVEAAARRAPQQVCEIAHANELGCARV